MHRTKRTVLAAASLLTLAGGGAAIAAGAIPSTQTTGSASKLVAVQVADSPDEMTVTDTLPTWTPVISTQITIPAKVTHALLLARYETSSQCLGSTPNSWCLARITVDGTEMNPQTGLGSVLDSVPFAGTGSTPAAHELARSLTVGPGTHTVTVAVAPWGDGISMHIDDSDLEVEAFK